MPHVNSLSSEETFLYVFRFLWRGDALFVEYIYFLFLFGASSRGGVRLRAQLLEGSPGERTGNHGQCLSRPNILSCFSPRFELESFSSRAAVAVASP